MDEKELNRRLVLIKDMFNRPEKYGMTADDIHQWALDHLSAVSDIIGRIPESLRDELADAAIEVYNEKKMKGG